MSLLKMFRVTNIIKSKTICGKSMVSLNYLKETRVGVILQIPIVQDQIIQRTISSKPIKDLLLPSSDTGYYHQQNTIKRNLSSKESISNDIKDFDPVKGKLIYVGSLSNVVKVVKGFSLTSSAIGLLLQPYMYSSLKEVEISFLLKIFMGGFFNFFIFLTPLLLHLITKRYITNMYYNDVTGRFYCTTLTFVLRNKEHSFTAEEVKVPPVSGIFTSFTVNGKPFLIDPSLFLDKEALIKLLGYDKPMDFTIPELDNDDEKKG